MDNRPTFKDVMPLLFSARLTARHMPETNIPLEEPCWVPREVVARLLEACPRGFWDLWKMLERYNDRAKTGDQLYPFQHGDKIGVCTQGGFRGFYANWTDEMVERYAKWLRARRRRPKLPADLARRLPVI